MLLVMLHTNLISGRRSWALDNQDWAMAMMNAVITGATNESSTQGMINDIAGKGLITS